MGNAKQASSTAEVDRHHLNCVRGKMHFARRSSEESAPGVVLPRYDRPMVTYDVTIRDARPIVDELSLDREGFTLIQHKTSCADVRDPEIMREKYNKEMVPFIKDYFNASWVVPKGDGLVLRRAGGSSIPGVRETIGPAHIDYARTYAPILAAEDAKAQGIPIRTYSRLMVIQAWRVLSPPPQDTPLALCDASSVLDADIVPHDFTSVTGASFTSCILHHDPLQRWYYFPQMTSGELILFKGYDSKESCNAVAPHQGFDNLRACPNAKTRESVEHRFYVYYA
ncbi:hypothetical protein ACVIHH_008292 [Bradyrhizobium sp. USDA 4518]